MPVFVDGTRLDTIPHDIDLQLAKIPSIKAGAERLCATSVKTVGPHKLLYIRQREYAATVPDDEHISILGTEEATTCHIVILCHTVSGSTALSHLDGTGTRRAVRDLIHKVEHLSAGSIKPEHKLELHLLGGFLDNRQTSRRLSFEIIQAFQQSTRDIHLVTACITALNDIIKGGVHYPVIRGAAVDVSTRDIYPATFPDQGPDMDIRGARTMTGGREVVDIYRYPGQLYIKPTAWKPMPDVDLWLALSDEQLLKNTSTSPEQEDASFVPDMRATFTVIRDNPHPEVTLFPGNQPRIYEKNAANGKWQRKLH